MPIRPRFMGNSNTHYSLSLSHLTFPPFTRGDLCRRGWLAAYLEPGPRRTIKRADRPIANCQIQFILPLDVATALAREPTLLAPALPQLATAALNAN